MISELSEKGYTIIPDVLSNHEIEKATYLFKLWISKVPGIKNFHANINPNGIFRYHQVGHQSHAWYIRTRPKVIQVFQEIYQTDELIVSFDGCGWFNDDFKNKTDDCWIHSDQAPKLKNFECIQGFVSLTSNQASTLVVYEGSHLLHKSYFANNNSGNNWQLIEPSFLKTIEDSKRILNVPAGSLVLWDSRTFHQNQYGYPNCEERLVQYVCYLPKNHPKNTFEVQKKRQMCFQQLRTSTHWPCPIRTVSLQPSEQEKKKRKHYRLSSITKTRFR